MITKHYNNIFIYKEYAVDIECYNSFMFFGNKKVGLKIEAWKAKIESLQGKSKDPLGLLIVRDVFNPKKHAQDSISYG